MFFSIFTDDLDRVHACYCSGILRLQDLLVKNNQEQPVDRLFWNIFKTMPKDILNGSANHLLCLLKWAKGEALNR